MKWNKKTFLDFKFNLYAKERIKQKNNNEHSVHGSKKEAAKKVINSNLFIDELSSMNKYFKEDHTLLLTKAVSDSRPQYRRRLLDAFKNNGEDNII